MKDHQGFLHNASFAMVTNYPIDLEIPLLFQHFPKNHLVQIVSQGQNLLQGADQKHLLHQVLLLLLVEHNREDLEDYHHKVNLHLQD